MIPLRVPPLGVVPSLGVLVVEATVARWLKREGESVVAGETVVELETDLLAVEVPAPKSGVVTKRLHAEGDIVRVDEVLAELDDSPAVARSPTGLSPTRGSTRRTHLVFISHSSRDEAIAEQVCAGLEQSGVPCWIAPRDIDFGAPYDEAIVDAIAASRAMVLVFSQHANASDDVLNEVRLAKQKGLLIVPLRIEKVPFSKSLTYHLSAAQWLDALTSDLGKHLPGLAARILRLADHTPESKSRTLR